MKSIAVLVTTLLMLATSSLAGPPDPCAGSPDHDGDGVCDLLDNCTEVMNAFPRNCDTDGDGYGNACDGDLDNTGFVNAEDFSTFFIPDFEEGVDSGVGSDMDCSGFVTATDFNGLFIPQFAKGVPGPSGLACAGQGTGPGSADYCFPD